MIGIPLGLAIIYQGGWLFLILILVLSLLGLKELGAILTKLNMPVVIPLAVPAALLAVLGFSLTSWWLVSLSFTLLIISIIIVLLTDYPRMSIMYLAGTLFSVIYIVWIFGFAVGVRSLDNGFILMVFLLLIIWGTDSGAYFAGYFFGKNPLAPQLSPKKTIEGSIGGLLVSVALGIIGSFMIELSFLTAIITAVLISLAAQIGDLFESMLKRTAGIKDSGNIIPGHGGILDRFDSFFISVALFYLIVQLVINDGLAI